MQAISIFNIKKKTRCMSNVSILKFAINENIIWDIIIINSEQNCRVKRRFIIHVWNPEFKIDNNNGWIWGGGVVATSCNILSITVECK